MYITGTGEGWHAESRYDFPAPGRLRRRQHYHFDTDWHGAVDPGFANAQPDSVPIHYTYALLQHDVPLAQANPGRMSLDWALPLPFHLWSDDTMCMVYGLNKPDSPGTLDFSPATPDSPACFSIYYPDCADQSQSWWQPQSPRCCDWQAGSSLEFEEIIAITPQQPDSDAFADSVTMAVDILRTSPIQPASIDSVTRKIVSFYLHNQLWHPDALGENCGWFSNMWVRVKGAKAACQGEMSGYFDLGWGEGVMPEFAAGAVRNWHRTGNQALLEYVDAMAGSIEKFRVGSEDAAPYHDRSDGRRYGDFMMDVTPGFRIWTHSLGHSANQLLRLYLEFPDYPNPLTRAAWRRMAESSAQYLARHQHSNGDLCDIFDADGQEANRKHFRIPARLAAAALWCRMAELTGDGKWLERAEALAQAVAPELDSLAFYGQMIDGVQTEAVNYMDGEAAYYAFEGLVPLFAATGKTQYREWCRRAAAFGIAWTYWYDLPHAFAGIARGGQCCRMPDTPLLYPIGPAKAIPLLLDFATASGQNWYREIAGEMANFIAHWQYHDAGKPWDGGIVHALGQFNGAFWGPDFEGQIDSGMATGNSLAALESWQSNQ